VTVARKRPPNFRVGCMEPGAPSRGRLVRDRQSPYGRRTVRGRRDGRQVGRSVLEESPWMVMLANVVAISAALAALVAGSNQRFVQPIIPMIP